MLDTPFIDPALYIVPIQNTVENVQSLFQYELIETLRRL